MTRNNVPSIPKDFKHIQARRYAEIKRTERRRQRIAGVLLGLCLIVGLSVIYWR